MVDALSQYRRFADLMMRELGARPSERICALVLPWLPPVQMPGSVPGQGRRTTGVRGDRDEPVALFG